MFDQATAPNIPFRTPIYYDENVNKKIVIRSAAGRLGQRGHIYPTREQATGRLLGVRELSPAEKLNVEYFITEETEVVIEDSFVFDLSKTRDRLHWNMVQHNEILALSRDECYFEGNPSRFYVEDLEAQTDNKLSESDRAFEAIRWVRSLGDTAAKDVARLTGENMRELSAGEVQIYLRALAGKTPAVIEKIQHDDNFKIRVFFYTLLDRRIVVESNELFSYKTYVLGHTPDACVGWLNNPQNADVVRHLFTLVNPVGTHVPGGGLPSALRGGIEGGEPGAPADAAPGSPEDVARRAASLLSAQGQAYAQVGGGGSIR